ncbi:DUF2806 domain-containing protein [Devosia lacusdianchii]|uniref:DUF2806 domain-containing protein n=1 Tax=Devosia lacusdianchii TaxID=2917991 RepID=UPI001F0542BD|nr:DUF2806 domain-containing protein [Devosia sp. JXJ CY 41]
MTGKAKGRALSVVQRWFGSALAPVIARNNRLAARERLLSSLEQEALKDLGAQAIDKLRSNPDAIDAVLDAIAPPGTTRKIDNTGAVFEKAIEDLRLNPPSDTQASSGAEEIAPEIADRLEHYASGASTDEVRERWGRVLAAEIRQPGTFSLKVLRIIDEIDDDLPQIFEEFAVNRFDNGSIPRCLSGRIKYSDQIHLVDAGLLHDPGTGGSSFPMRVWGSVELSNGDPVWAYEAGNSYFTIPREGSYSVEFHNSEQPIVSEKGLPATPSYILTTAGLAIGKILPPVDNARPYLAALRNVIPGARLWVRHDGKEKWAEVDPLPADLAAEGTTA